MLTGRAPRACATDAISPPSALRADVPAAVDQLVLRCLADDPADRYLTAAEVVHAVRQQVAGETGC